MQEKTTSRESAKEKMGALADITEQAARNYEQALRTGLKFQQEAAQWCTGMLDRCTSPDDWQKRIGNFTSLVNGLKPATQKRMEEVLDLMEKNNRTCMELCKKAADAAQTAVIADSQAKWMDFWSSSCGAARSNAEAAVQINARAMESWMDFVQKGVEMAQPRASRM